MRQTRAVRRRLQPTPRWWGRRAAPRQRTRLLARLEDVAVLHSSGAREAGPRRRRVSRSSRGSVEVLGLVDDARLHLQARTRRVLSPDVVMGSSSPVGRAHPHKRGRPVNSIVGALVRVGHEPSTVALVEGRPAICQPDGQALAIETARDRGSRAAPGQMYGNVKRHEASARSRRRSPMSAVQSRYSTRDRGWWTDDHVPRDRRPGGSPHQHRPDLLGLQ